MTYQLKTPHIAAAIAVVIAMSAIDSISQTSATPAATPSPETASSPSAPLENRTSKLEEKIVALEGKILKPPKDHWDKLSALSGFISGILVAAIGAVVTVMYKRRETAFLEAQKRKEEEDRKTKLEMDHTQQETERATKAKEITISQAQLVRELLPALNDKDAKTKQAALSLVFSLGNEDLAAQLAIIFQGDFNEVLQSVVETPGAKPEDRIGAAVALGRFGKGEQSVTALVQLSNDEKIETARRLSIADELEKLGELEGAAEVHLKAGLDPKTRAAERQIAMAALKRLDYTDKAKGKISEVLRSEQESLRQRLVAIEAWSELDSSETETNNWTSILLDMIRDSKTPSDLNAILQTCRSLGRGEQAAQALWETGSDSKADLAVRYAAVESLIKPGVERFAKQAVEERKEILRQLARDSLADPILRLTALREGLGAESNDDNAVILREIIASPHTSRVTGMSAIVMLEKLGYEEEAREKTKKLMPGLLGRFVSALILRKPHTAKKDPAKSGRSKKKSTKATQGDSS